MSGALEVDPVYLSSLIGQEVEAESCSGSRHRGRCLSVDPVSGSLVLVSKEKLLLLPWIDVVMLNNFSYEIKYSPVKWIPDYGKSSSVSISNLWPVSLYQNIHKNGA